MHFLVILRTLSLHLPLSLSVSSTPPPPPHPDNDGDNGDDGDDGDAYLTNPDSSSFTRASELHQRHYQKSH
jgi:hypothetical protein